MKLKMNLILMIARIRELLLDDLKSITGNTFDLDHLSKMRTKVISVELERISLQLFCPFLEVSNHIDSK